MRNILITGGAGFIGSHVVKRFVNQYPEYLIITLDKLTYAGNLDNLKELDDCTNHIFIKGDICDAPLINQLFNQYNITDVIHLAAESHVDRSIESPLDFVSTNVIGTVNLLNATKTKWKSQDNIFYHVSTDEVFGSLGETGLFTEETPYDPRSPYSASKAASDHFVRAFYHTYGLSIKLSNCSNNYGPFHHPEKLIPLVIDKIINNEPIPVYGSGQNVRDWLWVEDHARAIDLIFHKGRVGESYNVGGLNEWTNLDVVNYLCDILDLKLDRPESTRTLISQVEDRPGHDMRYAIDSSKLVNELGWQPSLNFKEGLVKTVNWYLDNQDWVKKVKRNSTNLTNKYN